MRISSMMSMAVAVAATFGAVSAAQAGIQVGGTRLIFDAKTDQREASLPVRNKGETPYVIQTFVDDGAGGAKTPFLTTPATFRLDGGKEQSVLVRHVAKKGVKLPEDRESVYWLDVKEIPPTDKANGKTNTLRIAVLTRIKVFYRPAGLTGAAADAPTALTWDVVPNPTGQGVALKVHNPTPYHVTFSKIDIAGPQAESINVDMVAPKSDLIIPVKSVQKAGPVQFSYTTINDFGAVTPATSVTST